MKRYLLLAIFAAMIVGGCAKESSRPKKTGEGAVRAINAIATSPDFAYLIEERFLESLRYKSASAPTEWDDLEYNFNFEALLAGDTEFTRIASVFIDVVKDRDYSILLSGAVDAPDVTIWEDDRREWEDTDTVFEIRFAHASPALGAVDVYFDVAGVAPAAGNEIGTIAFGEILPAQDFDTTERIFFLTPANDPGTILFESGPLALTERTSYIFAPFDTTANDVGPLPVMLINATFGGISPVPDVNTRSTARFFNASLNMGNVDIYIDDPLTAPIVTNQAFGEFTGDLPVPSGVVPVTYTAAGNMGSILIDADRLFTVNRRHSLFTMRNAAGEDVSVNFVIDRRSIETRSTLTLVNTSTNHPAVDIYIVPAGEPIDEVLPTISSLTTLTAPTPFPLVISQYDLYVTVRLEKTVLLGPIALDAQAGDVFEAVLYDTVDPNVPNLVFIPLP